MKKIHLSILLIISFGIYFLPQENFAQEKEQSLQEDVNQDDLGNVTDEFQEYFFEALAQKAIENYEKAITALKKCEAISPNETVVKLELGKNYKALKKYELAEENLKIALAEKPENREVLTELYDVYYLTEDYEKAIKIAQQLKEFNINYYEDLANLYVRISAYEKALDALDTIDKEQGQDEYREALRMKIFSETGDKSQQIAYLERSIQQNPKEIRNYSNLIYLYRADNKPDKAYETALELQKIYPDAEEAHIALYPVYIDQKAYDEAVQSMKIVLQSKMFEEESKLRVLQDLVNLVKEHPRYEKDLLEVVGDQPASNHQSPKQLANYYIGRDNQKAIENFKLALQENPNDFDVLQKLVLLQLEEQQYAEVVTRTEEALGNFPTQPVLYLLNGVAHNELKNHQDALENLEMGLDYLLDSPNMEADFYLQMAKAYQGLNKPEEAEKFQQKAKRIKNNLD